MKKSAYNSLSPFSNGLTSSFYQRLSGKKLIFPFYHSVAFKPLLHIDSLYKTRSEVAFKDDLNYLQKQAQKFIDDDLLSIQNQILKPTPKGKFLTDGIASDLFLVNLEE